MLAKELMGSTAEENGCFLKLGVGGPGAEVVSAKGAGNAVNGFLFFFLS